VRFRISRRGRRPSAYGITTADGSHLADVSRRQKQYAATMLFRVAAILVVVFVPGLSVMPRVILGLVATVIPYFAVIRANGGPPQDPDPTHLMIGAPRQPELPTPDRSIAATPGAEDGEWTFPEAGEDDVTERQNHPE
jgi:hypothetical protein